MADKDESRQPSHRAYTVIRREGQDDLTWACRLRFRRLRRKSQLDKLPGGRDDDFYRLECAK